MPTASINGQADWPPPERWPALAAAEIHLWRATLTDWRSPAYLKPLAATLEQDERQRATRFHLPAQSDGFIIGRGLLRMLLGRYLHRPAATLRFGANPYGKPLLTSRDAAAILHFNLSHSGEQLLYAIAHRPVGVDLERLDRPLSIEPLAQRICTPVEWAAFQALPTAQRPLAFLRCWSRKEASVKAMGSGLASGLCTLPVCDPAWSDAGERACWTDTAGVAWSVLNLELTTGWSGALAAQGTDWRWRGFRLQRDWPAMIGARPV